MTVTIPTTDLRLEDIWLSDPEQWLRPDREGIFAKLRAEAPVLFQEEMEPPPDFPYPRGPGYFAVTRYADDVRNGTYPSAAESYALPAETADALDIENPTRDSKAEKS